MKRLIISLIVAWAFIATAQAAESPAPAPAPQEAAADQPEGGKRDSAATRDAHEAFCLRHTGSRIPVRADRRTGRKDAGCIAAHGRVYSRDDLDRTGEIDIADALRKLDPSIR